MLHFQVEGIRCTSCCSRSVPRLPGSVVKPVSPVEDLMDHGHDPVGPSCSTETAVSVAEPELIFPNPISTIHFLPQYNLV
jgi:hypothetical protein